MLISGMLYEFPGLYFSPEGNGGGGGNGNGNGDDGGDGNGDNGNGSGGKNGDDDDDGDQDDKDDELFDELGIDPKDFDPKRALRTIRAQRKAENKLKGEAKDQKKKIEVFEAEKKKLDDADKTEVDKLKGEVGELTQERDDLKSRGEKMAIRHAIEKTAMRLKFGPKKDQRFRDPADAYELLDLSKIDYDADEGQVEGVMALLKQLATDKLYLLDGEPGEVRGTPKSKALLRKKLKERQQREEDGDEPDKVKINF